MLPKWKSALYTLCDASKHLKLYYAHFLDLQSSFKLSLSQRNVYFNVCEVNWRIFLIKESIILWADILTTWMEIKVTPGLIPIRKGPTSLACWAGFMSSIDVNLAFHIPYVKYIYTYGVVTSLSPLSAHIIILFLCFDFRY